MRTFGPLAAVHLANVLDGEQSESHRPMPASGFDGDYLDALKVQDQLANWCALAQNTGEPHVGGSQTPAAANV